VRKDCTVGKLSERNEAGNEADGEEAVRRRSQSCARGVGVAQPRSELYVRDRSWRWTVPLHLSWKQGTQESICHVLMALFVGFFLFLLHMWPIMLSSVSSHAAKRTFALVVLERQRSMGIWSSPNEGTLQVHWKQ
jgi:hypothetical protein